MYGELLASLQRACAIAEERCDEGDGFTALVAECRMLARLVGADEAGLLSRLDGVGHQRRIHARDELRRFVAWADDEHASAAAAAVRRLTSRVLQTTR